MKTTPKSHKAAWMDYLTAAGWAVFVAPLLSGVPAHSQQLTLPKPADGVDPIGYGITRTIEAACPASLATGLSFTMEFPKANERVKATITEIQLMNGAASAPFKVVGITAQPSIEGNADNNNLRARLLETTRVELVLPAAQSSCIPLRPDTIIAVSGSGVFPSLRQ